jgi:hypothetical protein
MSLESKSHYVDCSLEKYRDFWVNYCTLIDDISKNTADSKVSVASDTVKIEAMHKQIDKFSRVLPRFSGLLQYNFDTVCQTYFAFKRGAIEGSCAGLFSTNVSHQDIRKYSERINNFMEQLDMGSLRAELAYLREQGIIDRDVEDIFSTQAQGLAGGSMRV